MSLPCVDARKALVSVDVKSEARGAGARFPPGWHAMRVFSVLRWSTKENKVFERTPGWHASRGDDSDSQNPLTRFSSAFPFTLFLALSWRLIRQRVKI